MRGSSILIALTLGVLTVVLGQGRLLKDVVEGFRNFDNFLGLRRSSRPAEIARGTRICFMIAGSALILLAVAAAAMEN